MATVWGLVDDRTGHTGQVLGNILGIAEEDALQVAVISVVSPMKRRGRDGSSLPSLRIGTSRRIVAARRSVIDSSR